MRCPQQGSWLPLMIGGYQGHSINPHSIYQHVSYIYPRWPNNHTHSKTRNPTNTTLPIDVSITGKVNAPPPLTEDHKDTLWLMQRMDPFCKHISKKLPSGKAPSHKGETFEYIKGHLYKQVMESSKKILSTSHPHILAFHSTCWSSW